MRYIDLQESKGLEVQKTKKLKKLRQKKVLAFLFAIIFFFSIFVFGSSILDLLKRTFVGPRVVFSFIFDDGGLKKDNGRTNILLLGTGGKGHEGPDLSDSMMVASVDAQNKDVTLISLPRDIWIDSLDAKINTAYAYGEERQKGGGLELAKSSVAEILGIEVHYAIRIDFSGFEKAIDTVGGITINVDRTFDDYKYPIAGREEDLCGFKIEEAKDATGAAKIVILDATGSAVPDDVDPFVCRYERLHFAKGEQQMNGEVALEYVRSRHGTNEEGSDFARSARQQKVLVAFKDKVLTTETLLDPKKVIGLIQNFGQALDTDIGDEEIPQFLKVFKLIQDSTPRNMVLTSVGEGALLENPQTSDKYHKAWVLIPKEGNWKNVQEKVREFTSQVLEKEKK